MTARSPRPASSRPRSRSTSKSTSSPRRRSSSDVAEPEAQPEPEPFVASEPEPEPEPEPSPFATPALTGSAASDEQPVAHAHPAFPPTQEKLRFGWERGERDSTAAAAEARPAPAFFGDTEAMANAKRLAEQPMSDFFAPRPRPRFPRRPTRPSRSPANPCRNPRPSPKPRCPPPRPASRRRSSSHRPWTPPSSRCAARSSRP